MTPPKRLFDSVQHPTAEAHKLRKRFRDLVTPQQIKNWLKKYDRHDLEYVLVSEVQVMLLLGRMDMEIKEFEKNAKKRRNSKRTSG